MGGAAPEEPPEGARPKPGAFVPGITGAGGAAHGTVEVSAEPEPVAAPAGAVGFATDPRLPVRPERLWRERLPS